MDKVYNIKTERIANLYSVHESENGKLKAILFYMETGEWDADVYLSDIVPYDYYIDKIRKLARSRIEIERGRHFFSGEKYICSDRTAYDFYDDAIRHEIGIIKHGVVFKHE